MSDHVLPKKSALVTGGAKRIGRAICDGLANLGFSIAVHANSSLEEAEDFASSLRESGVEAVALKADLRNEAETLDLIRQAHKALGGIGVVVNNASLFQPDWVTDFDRETWDGHFDVHVRAPSILAGEYARLLDADEKGLIVNIIDQRVWAPTPNYYSYMLSKAAMLMATKTMAMSLAPRIRVNAIGPGPTLPNVRQTREDFESRPARCYSARGRIWMNSPAPSPISMARRP